MRLIKARINLNPHIPLDTFCEALVPEFIGALPADPSLSDQSISEDECDEAGKTTGYSITAITGGHYTISAPETVNVDSGTTETDSDNIISITR